VTAFSVDGEKCTERELSERSLSDDTRAELWHIIDSREWFLKAVVNAYQGEQEQIEGGLEVGLSG
jgi:hypothetical protein